MIVGLIVLAVIVLLVLWFVATYNGLIRARNRVKEAFSTMDVYMKKRFDLIPNLVATVKGYAKHEAETLEKVIAMRGGMRNATPEEKIQGDKEISQAVRGLMIQVEAYPELKANTNFMDLQKQLQNIESEIAQSRKYYNGCVLQYNNMCETIPSNIIANCCGFQMATMYEVDSTEERKAVKVEF